jgi:5-(carboxyamino)imidazole ribonucleotide mutase
MNGTDSLYSIVQMPPGIPVATMAINGAKNAGILAARILGITQQNIAENLSKFSNDMESSVLDKANNLKQKGHRDYLKSM